MFAPVDKLLLFIMMDSQGGNHEANDMLLRCRYIVGNKSSCRERGENPDILIMFQFMIQCQLIAA